MKNKQKILSALALHLILICCTQTVSAEPYETIAGSGIPEQTVDIVIMGDAYTAGQMSKYRADAQNFVNALFSQEPFREYQRYFNVHRIDVVSNDGVCDDRATGTNPDTRLNCARLSENSPAGGIVVQSRILTIDAAVAQQILDASVAPALQDLRVVLVNTSTYGGSEIGNPRGAFAVSYVDANNSNWEALLHEIGHVFGPLADEYDYGTCSGTLPPGRDNVTNTTLRSSIPWAVWIDALTPLPTTTAANGVSGLYEGAVYCKTGFYRPTYDSKMRTLGRPFEQINVEQLLRRIYQYVPLPLTAAPSGDQLILVQGASQRFDVTLPAPLTHALTVTWDVDGTQEGDWAGLYARYERG